MKKIVSCILLSILIALSCSLPVFAQDGAPTDSFIRWGGQSVPMKPVYVATETVDARSLGLEDGFGVIRDIDTDEKGNIYVLTEDSRVISFNQNLEYNKTYAIVDVDGLDVAYDDAYGICVVSEDVFYIADTQNIRVILCENGVMTKEIFVPDSALIPSDFKFNPMKVEVDSKGFMYVICEGSYYGAVLFNPEGEFVQFFGANTTNGSILGTLGLLWDKLTMNDAKRAKKVKTLPYQFIDLTLDQNDFVYTCTSKNAGSEAGQLRMLSPGGTNILSKGGALSDSFNFGESDYVKIHNARVEQDFAGVQVDERGFIYTIDKSYGLVYIYDNQCNLISAFGGGGVGYGDKTGVFDTPCAITYYDSKVYVADSKLNKITVFERTDYGELLLSAQEKTLNSDHAGAAPLWENVQKLDKNNALALSALAKASYADKDYDSALAYAKEAKDSEIYSLALGYVQKDYLTKNYLWITPLILILIAGCITLLVVSKKKQLVFVKNEKVRTMFSAVVHPFQAYNEIKLKDKGSVLLAAIMTVLFYVSSVFATIGSDFRYSSFDTSSYNALFQIIRTVGLIAIWSLANWSVCTLMQGRGKLKEIFIVTAYSTLPICVYNIVTIPLTYLLTDPASGLISGMYTIALILTAIMLCIGLMIIHDFDFFRFLLTAVITVLFILVVIFFVFLIGILFSQFWEFIVAVFVELLYR